MKPEISIIVPVYNVEPYLKRCLDSIVNQSMKEIEILVIDDGSTDKSAEICDDYAMFDNRIKVIHQKNGGLSRARNVGLNQAQSKYIMFVDSDDFVERDFCKIPYEIAEKNDCDLVMFCFRYLKNGLETGKNNSTELDDSFLSKENAVLFMNTVIHDYIWNKLYKAELFKNSSFPNNRLFEDIGTFYKLLLKSKTIYFTNSVLYNYAVRSNSITKRRNLNMKFDYLEMVYDKTYNLNTSGYNYYIDTYTLVSALRYLTCFGFNADLSSKCCELVKHFNYKPGSLNIRSTILFYLCNHSTAIYDVLCILFNKRGDVSKYLFK